MKSLTKLLVVLASAGLAGSVHAVEQVRNPGAPTDAQFAVLYAPAGTGAPMTRAAYYPAPGPSSRTQSPEPVLEIAWTGDETRIDRGALATPGGIVAPKTRGADSRSRFSTPTTPEPAEWMQLLCGLVVAGFIARRRTSVAAG